YSFFSSSRRRNTIFSRDWSSVVCSSDLVVVALLAHGSVAIALTGLDTGTAFGGMGASREVTILALVEPTALVAIFALSVRVGSTSLPEIVGSTLDDPARVVAPASLPAPVALAMVSIAGPGRRAGHNPST